MNRDASTMSSWWSRTNVRNEPRACCTGASPQNLAARVCSTVRVVLVGADLLHLVVLPCPRPAAQVRWTVRAELIGGVEAERPREAVPMASSLGSPAVGSAVVPGQACASPGTRLVHEVDRSDLWTAPSGVGRRRVKLRGLPARTEVGDPRPLLCPPSLTIGRNVSFLGGGDRFKN
jgi:hypothetical protein